MTAGGRRLDLVVPDLFDHVGGIARISRATALACHDYAVARGLRLTVHALRDRGEARDARYVPSPARYLGYRGSRARLAAAVVGSATAPGHTLTVFGHVNLATLGLAFRPSFGWPPRRRFAVVLHGIEVWSPLSRARRHALRAADALWPISTYTAERARALHGLDPTRLTVIPNCLDPGWSLGDPDAAEHRAAPPYFLAVTRLEPNTPKGVDHTIAAFSSARAALPAGARLVVAGDGGDRGRLEQLAATLGLADAVTFAGFVAAAELEALFGGCLAFVLPSANEGFGLVFVEAMAHARPVIAARAGGAPEVVGHGETGLLVEFGDVAALADAMISVASDPTAAAALGRRGHAVVGSRFTFERYATDVARELDRLIAGAS